MMNFEYDLASCTHTGEVKENTGGAFGAASVLVGAAPCSRCESYHPYIVQLKFTRTTSVTLCGAEESSGSLFLVVYQSTAAVAKPAHGEDALSACRAQGQA